MDSRTIVVFVVMALYTLLVVGIGWVSQRQTKKTSEDYFLASRSISGFFLFCAIIGANLSSFVMLGMPGGAYHNGFGMYGLIMGAGSFLIGFTTYYFGLRIWVLGKKFGYSTPSQVFGGRFNSDTVALIMFIIFAVYTMPYVVTGQIGAGAGFETFTNGIVPYWLGSLIITVIVGYYVWGGGMRGTVLTNALQVVIFAVFLLIAVVMIANGQGGFSALTERVMAEQPHLLSRDGSPAFSWQGWFSQWLLFAFVVLSFPHVILRLLAAKSSTVLRQNSVMYPLGMSFIYILAVTLGVWGAVLIPGLEGAQSDNIVFMLTFEYLPVWMSGLALAGLFAMVMSTMDAQLLTMSNMFTTDVIEKYFGKDKDINGVFYGRVFVVVLLAISYIVSLIRPASVFEIANLSFTGTVVMMPVILAALYWRRLNRYGAISSLVAGAVLVPVYFFTDWLPDFGFLPVVPSMAIAALVMVVVSLATKPEYENADRHLDVLNDVLRKKPAKQPEPEYYTKKAE
ncbi:solute:Na+ symporter, SSS family [Alteribacillus persepolensis]|uniref:Solute:Na+ symporter, SSS family n=1 Tax=Alteribacillus persepolensis TaxID=568899 RepID=A0A1G8GXR7_9BACI|nr:sodium:solute symporter family protein [Alteribacillus persepolensis]SDH99196.1 solute:Na+ symporter, SSS family [Alteribacillus persepolensis]